MRLLESANQPLTAGEIASILGVEITPEEVYEHLRHVAKTVYAKTKGRKVLVMDPPVCRKCGFVFKELDKPKKPSRCPKCKGEWISPPRFAIVDADDV